MFQIILYLKGKFQKRVKMRVLVISIGWEQRLLVEKLALIEAEIFGVHYDDNYIKDVDFKDIKICDIRDLEAILEYAKKIRPDAVVSDNCDYSLLAQSFVAYALGLAGPSLEAAQISNNKFLQRERASQSGIKTPLYKLCLSVEDVKDFAQKVDFPLIVKPVDNRGSFGVSKITNKAEIDKAYQGALLHSHSRLVLIEEFIDGVQITIDGYSFPSQGAKSLAIGDKILKQEDGEVATTISYPCALDRTIQDRALLVNEEVSRCFGYDFGMTHAEFMISKDGIYLIESTNRGGGVFTSSIIAPYSSGIDLLEQYICDCLQIKKDLYIPSRHQEIVLKFFRFPPLGMIIRVEGYNKILHHPKVVTSKIFVKPGDTILPITNDANRHGFIIFKGKESEAQALIDKMRIVFAE